MTVQDALSSGKVKILISDGQNQATMKGFGDTRDNIPVQHAPVGISTPYFLHLLQYGKNTRAQKSEKYCRCNIFHSRALCRERAQSSAYPIGEIRISKSLYERL